MSEGRQDRSKIIKFSKKKIGATAPFLLDICWTGVNILALTEGGSEMLNINKNKEGANCTIALEGRLDTVTSPDLEKEIEELKEGLEELIFDLEKLEYISSSGLRVLLAAQKAMSKQGSMKVTNVTDPIMEIFDVTGFSDILVIE